MRNDILPAFPIVVLLLATPIAAAEIHGRVELLGKDGEPLPEGRESVVYFEPAVPLDSAAPAAEAEERFEIVTVRKDFAPHVLAVPRGSTVAFPNEDTILHNVFSVSGENRFDLGLYRGGVTREVQFDHPGVVKVFCNVHHSMAASVLVLDTPFFTQPEFDGRFALDLPEPPSGEALQGKLTVWHERSDPWTREIVLPLTGPLEVQLRAVRERVEQHRNKFGKPYRTRRGRDY